MSVCLSVPTQLLPEDMGPKEVLASSGVSSRVYFLKL